MLAAITDDLIEHGDVNAALRRLMNDGLRAADGERHRGAPRAAATGCARRAGNASSASISAASTTRSPASSTTSSTRSATPSTSPRSRSADAAERHGDGAPRRRGRATTPSERRFDLDLLPDDLAGKVTALQQHDFVSEEAERRFEALLDRLRSQLGDQMFEQMSGSMQSMSPQSPARIKDMLADLNEMLARHRRGEDPRFDEFMERYGDFFPENPQTLDELLEALARRMAAMQAMLNSMTPEQRDAAAAALRALLDDIDLRGQIDQLGEQLRALVPGRGWDASYDFNGDDPLGLGEALRRWSSSATSTSSSRCSAA